MKAICDNSPKPVSCGVKDGKVSKSKDKAVEAEEMQIYLTRLKELVPYMPKNKKISKLEVIQNVIDYIRDLQDALETVPPAKVSTSNQSNHHRQPLGVIATNFPLLNACSSYESTQLDKSPSSVERPVSC